MSKDAEGKPILSKDDIETLHEGALARCDLDDGVKDGVIGDPQACDFEPAQLRCPIGNGARCLTERQVEAAAKVYGGPMTSAGQAITRRFALPGSERSWPIPPVNKYMYNYMKSWAHYGLFEINLGVDWTPDDFDFDPDYKRLGAMDILQPMHQVDLRRFKEAGGKLLLYSGWNDSVEGVLNTVTYYESAEKIVGDRVTTQEFFRLFMVPGMDHCSGGDGAHLFDFLGYLEKWSEQGQAPDKLIGAHPGPNGQVQFTRPIYPYPLKAKYSGRGDPKDAASFEPEYLKSGGASVNSRHHFPIGQ